MFQEVISTSSGVHTSKLGYSSCE